ncbi:meta/HslJ family protein 1 [Achromobacter ruhlandii]|nr:meta/HslJ family protein 1 [Achromobacter ruhlandii]
MKKTILLASVCAALLQACAPVSHTGEGSSTMSTSSSTPAANALSLPAYYWRLVSATEASGKSIPALQKGVEQPLRLSFTADALNVRGGCNTQFGGYTYKDGVLRVANLASTMKACEPALMQLDAEIGQRLKGDLRATLGGESTEPTLELVAQDGSVLKFVGEPTPETLYGSAGEIMFLEVAPKRADCSHPMIPRYQCLMVRERRYNEAGVQLPPQEDWHPLYQSIEGYDHRDGVRTVLRVKRYDWKNPPADAPAKVYVLDMVVEQDASGKKK